MPASVLNTSLLRSRLKLKNLQSANTFSAHHPHAASWLNQAGVTPAKLRAHASKLLASGTLAGTLLLSPSQPTAGSLPAASSSLSEFSTLTSNQSLQQNIKDQLSQILPSDVRQLNEEQEQLISESIHSIFGIHATATLQGERLNRDYGYIGQEQHLKRYPGDSLSLHSEPLKEGMAPGLGAWGFFATSKSELSPELEQIEKYYVAVQTLYLPDWNTRTSLQRQWWKYRKMVVVNPANGKVVVAAVGDSGPSWWTGKHFGGSPEVMAYLNMKDGRQKGPVVMFFLNDPDNTIPLGPVEYNIEKPPLLPPGAQPA